jgi:hypothetical protein
LATANKESALQNKAAWHGAAAARHRPRKPPLTSQRPLQLQCRLKLIPGQHQRSHIPLVDRGWRTLAGHMVAAQQMCAGGALWPPRPACSGAVDALQAGLLLLLPSLASVKGLRLGMVQRSMAPLHLWLRPLLPQLWQWLLPPRVGCRRCASLAAWLAQRSGAGRRASAA